MDQNSTQSSRSETTVAVWGLCDSMVGVLGLTCLFEKVGLSLT